MTKYRSTSLFLCIIFAMSLVACSSSKKATQDQSKQTEERKPLEQVEKKVCLKSDCNIGLKTFKASGDIDFKMPDLSNSASFNLLVASDDSLQMIIRGPLGITVAKLYATKTKFQFLNSFSGELYQGTPSRKNFEQIANIPVEFRDLLCILTSRLSFSHDKYILNTSNDEKQQYVYSGKGFTDVAYFPADLSYLHYYARYNKEKDKSEKSFEIFYSNITNIGKYSFAKTIKMNFPALNGNVEIKYDKIQVNTEINEPFSFKLSKKLKVYDLD